MEGFFFLGCVLSPTDLFVCQCHSILITIALQYRQLKEGDAYFCSSFSRLLWLFRVFLVGRNFNPFFIFLWKQYFNNKMVNTSEIFFLDVFHGVKKYKIRTLYSLRQMGYRMKSFCCPFLRINLSVVIKRKAKVRVWSWVRNWTKNLRCLIRCNSPPNSIRHLLLPPVSM